MEYHRRGQRNESPAALLVRMPCGITMLGNEWCVSDVKEDAAQEFEFSESLSKRNKIGAHIKAWINVFIAALLLKDKKSKNIIN